MANFEKLTVKWKPNDIKGSFGVPPFSPFYCSYCNIRFKTALEYDQHMAKHHPKDAGFGAPKVDVSDVGIGAPKVDVSINPRDLFPPEEQQSIDEYIEYADYLNGKLKSINDECNKQLETLMIPIDKDKDFLLYEAMNCPYCGRKNAGTNLTAQDFAIKRSAAKTRNKSLFSHADPDTIGYKTPNDIRQEQDHKFRNMIKIMMRGVWNQILIWVLSFIYMQVRPLNSIKYVKKIPQKIKAAIDGLKSGMGLTLKDQLSGIGKAAQTVSSDMSEAESDKALEEAYADIDPVSSIPEIAQEMSLFYCIYHEKNFFERANSAVSEQSAKHTAWLAIKEANDAQISNIKVMQTLAGSRVPDDYETPGGIKFEANLPEEYLKARRDGSTKFSSIWSGGMKDTFDTINNDFAKSFENMMKTWVSSPVFLCCILRIITQVVTLGKEFDDKAAIFKKYKERVTKGRRLLLMIKGLLEVVLNLLTFDVNKSVVELGNFIISLVNSLIQKIFASLGQLIDSGINKYALNVKDLTRYKAFGRECLPWLELMGSLGDYLDRFMKELGAYIASLFANAKLSALKSKQILKDSTEIMKLDMWIRMIDKILGFMKFWEICIENVEPGIDGMQTENNRLSEAASRDLDSRYTTNLMDDFAKKDKKFATIYTDKSVTGRVTGRESGKRDYGGGTIKVLSADEQRALDQASELFKHTDPWSLDGVKILLTNFMGYPEQTAVSIISSDGECNCDKILSDSELQKFQNILEGKT